MYFCFKVNDSNKGKSVKLLKMKLTNYRNIHKFIGILMLLFIVVAISIMFFKVIGVNPDTRLVKTHKSLTSKELFAELQNRSSEDLIDFIEKAIEVEGVIKEINYRNSIYTVMLEGGEYKRHIICEMQRDQNSEILK